MSTSSAVNSAYSALRNSSRLSGMASGMDTETIVKSLMNVEKLKYNKVYQQKTKLEWTTDAYKDVNNLLKSFQNTYLSALGSNNILSASTINARKVTMDSATNAVSISANSDAIVSSHTIKVNSLATGANASGALGSTTISTGTKLADLALTNDVQSVDGVVSFAINGQTFSFNDTDTLATVISRVNSNSAAGVKMNFSSLTGKLTITSKTLGSGSSLQIENISGNLFASSNAAFGMAEGTYANGTDASVEIDGIAVTQNTNSFTIDGVTYSLKNTTDTAVGFQVDNDVDSAVDAITKFVDAYNTLIGTLNDKIGEDYDRNYAPLTDDQKDAMSDDEIEKWEKIAKTGLLHKDSYVSGLLQSMRSAFYETVQSAGLSASSIGLTTANYADKGKISLNTDKLREALTNNPDAVTALFTATSKSTDAATNRSESGLAVRLRDAVNGYLTDYTKNRSPSYTEQLDDFADKLNSLQDYLDRKEEQYWKQFTAMETALSKLNSQMSSLSSLMSSNSSNS